MTFGQSDVLNPKITRIDVVLIKSDYLKFEETEIGEFLYQYSVIFEYSGPIYDFYKLEVKLKKKRK